MGTCSSSQGRVVVLEKCWDGLTTSVQVPSSHLFQAHCQPCLLGSLHHRLEKRGTTDETTIMAKV